MTPPSPGATFSEICSDGRLAITVSTRSATSAGDEASLRAQRHQRRDRVVARVVDDEFVAGLDQPPRHRLPHIAQTDKADVHVRFLPCHCISRPRLCPTHGAVTRRSINGSRPQRSIQKPIELIIS